MYLAIITSLLDVFKMVQGNQTLDHKINERTTITHV